MFPWAGQAVFKSGYDDAATWAWFAVGPYGSSGHAHRAKLALALRAHGMCCYMTRSKMSVHQECNTTLNRPLVFVGLLERHIRVNETVLYGSCRLS